MKHVLLALALLAVLLLSQPSDGRNFYWLTNHERSLEFPNYVLKFYGSDTLWGPVHSNDWIATMFVFGGLPVFYNTISTAQPGFYHESPNPAGNFAGGPPIFNAPEIVFPTELTYIRAEAIRQEQFHQQPGMEWRGQFAGTILDLYYYPEGTPFDPNTAELISIDLTLRSRMVVFVDGKLDLKGELSPMGCALVLGCSQNVRIIDNVMLAGTDEENGALPEGATSALALASEESILIANTWENGRENRAQGSDVVITAYLFAIRGTIQFEQMNDDGDDYVCSCAPDERGKLVLTGALAQNYRGFMHRSNRNGTGYNRRYHFDQRLRNWRVGVFEPFLDGDEWVSDADESVVVPKSFSLAAYPNPFNAQATIAFDLPQAGEVSLRLYDVLGHEIATLLNEQKTAGAHTVSLTAADLPTGIYFATLESGTYRATQKLLLLK